MRTETVTNQVKKELIVDIYVNRNKVITKALFNAPIFHGYQDLLTGQTAITSLSVTPRIYGFCGGSHQQAAAMALEHLADATIPPNAHAIRSIIQAAEMLQNSIKWFYTSFAPILTDTAFQNSPLYATIVERFSAFQGSSFKQGLIGGTFPISLYSLIAGHWPHADFIIPGGVGEPLNGRKLVRAKAIIQHFKTKWIEPILLNGRMDSYLAINSWEALLAWVYRKHDHQKGDLGLFLRACLDYQLDSIGGSKNSFISYGSFWNKKSTLAMNPAHYQKSVQFSAGIFNKKNYNNLNTTEVIAQLNNASGLPIETMLANISPYETGALARMLLLAKGKHKTSTPTNRQLLKEMYLKKGASVFIRAFARLHEIMILTNFIEKELAIIEEKGAFFTPTAIKDGIGFGMIEAPRGALSHLVNIQKGMIQKYQILAPTIRNINTGVNEKRCAPLGQTLVGMTIENLQHPIEVALIARSFDACLRCHINLWKSSGQKELGKFVI